MKKQKDRHRQRENAKIKRKQKAEKAQAIYEAGERGRAERLKRLREEKHRDAMLRAHSQENYRRHDPFLDVMNSLLDSGSILSGLANRSRFR